LFENFRREMRYIGLKNIVTYFFFQRMLRINSHVPWPVHFSSIVVSPEKIVRKFWRPYPGFTPCCYIQAANGIIIGINVRMGPGIKMISVNHNVTNFDLYETNKPILIGNNCWLGANVIILPGVELADHTIVAAGAVVTKSFLQGDCIIAGVPAKFMKKIDPYQM
jgi:hypothetical protein